MEILFSDKTGTLTENIMIFKVASWHKYTGGGDDCYRKPP